MRLSLDTLRLRRRQTATLRDLLVVLRHSLCRKFQSRFLGFGKSATLQLRKFPRPFVFRLGTTDFHTALEVLDGNEYGTVLRHVTNPSLVIDLGANIGLSCLVWREAWPECRIVAVEPDSDNMKLVRRNLDVADENGTPDVRLHRAAVSTFNGFGALDRTDGAWAYRLVPSSTGEIPVITMEDIIREFPSDLQIDFLKCDIEGSEAELFSNPGAWIRRIRWVAVETHPPYNLDALETDLKKAGIQVEILERQIKTGCAVGLYRLVH
jgi:FkbM family methyltransferase